MTGSSSSSSSFRLHPPSPPPVPPAVGRYGTPDYAGIGGAGGACAPCAEESGATPLLANGGGGGSGAAFGVGVSGSGRGHSRCGNGHCGNGGVSPLLANGGGGNGRNGGGGHSGHGGVCGGIVGNGSAFGGMIGVPVQSTHDVRTEHLLSHQRKQTAEFRKNVFVAALFALSTASQIYVGIKCISFRGLWATNPQLMSLQGALFGVAVLLINVESWMIKRLVNAITAEVGHYVPEFHSHPLYFRPDMPRHKCDLCRSRTNQVHACVVKYNVV